jgi:sporulation protein YlmC with PRC-barrel domain
MLKSRLVLGAVGALLLATPAFAQNSPAAPISSGGPGVGAAMTSYITSEKTSEWRLSKLRGLHVYNNGNEKIGEVEEFLISSDGTINGAVISVGGFLGIGEHYVAVPFKSIQFTHNTDVTASTNRSAGAGPSNGVQASSPGSGSGMGSSSGDDPDRAVFNATKDQLKAAAQFQYRR